LYSAIEARVARGEMDQDGRAIAGLAMAYHTLGRQEEAAEQLATYIANHGEEDPREVARIYAWRNEKDQAFEWFERADALGSDRESMLVANPLFRNLHGDPRWEAILEERGYSERQLAELDFPVDLLTQYRSQ
jgi:tetratricopeptide (TPR) repeat protein